MAISNRSIIAFFAATVAILALSNHQSYREGWEAGRETGLYDGQSAYSLELLADSCDELGVVYDETPAAEKIAQDLPQKWDNSVCEKFRTLSTNHLTAKYDHHPW